MYTLRQITTEHEGCSACRWENRVPVFIMHACYPMHTMSVYNMRLVCEIVSAVGAV